MSDLSIIALKEGVDAFEWLTRQAQKCILFEAKEGGISKEECRALMRGLGESRKVFLEAWERFCIGRGHENEKPSGEQAPNVETDMEACGRD